MIRGSKEEEANKEDVAEEARRIAEAQRELEAFFEKVSREDEAFDRWFDEEPETLTEH